MVQNLFEGILDDIVEVVWPTVPSPEPQQHSGLPKGPETQQPSGLSTKAIILIVVCSVIGVIFLI